MDSDCRQAHTCIRGVCIDLCTNSCGKAAICRTESHRAICTCPSGYKGNASVECIPILQSTKVLTKTTPIHNTPLVLITTSFESTTSSKSEKITTERTGSREYTTNSYHEEHITPFEPATETQSTGRFIETTKATEHTGDITRKIPTATTDSISLQSESVKMNVTTKTSADVITEEEAYSTTIKPGQYTTHPVSTVIKVITPIKGDAEQYGAQPPINWFNKTQTPSTIVSEITPALTTFTTESTVSKKIYTEKYEELPTMITKSTELEITPTISGSLSTLRTTSRDTTSKTHPVTLTYSIKETKTDVAISKETVTPPLFKSYETSTEENTTKGTDLKTSLSLDFEIGSRKELEVTGHTCRYQETTGKTVVPELQKFTKYGTPMYSTKNTEIPDEVTDIETTSKIEETLTSPVYTTIKHKSPAYSTFQFTEQALTPTKQTTSEKVTNTGAPIITMNAIKETTEDITTQYSSSSQLIIETDTPADTSTKATALVYTKTSQIDTTPDTVTAEMMFKPTSEIAAPEETETTSAATSYEVMPTSETNSPVHKIPPYINTENTMQAEVKTTAAISGNSEYRTPEVVGKSTTVPDEGITLGKLTSVPPILENTNNRSTDIEAISLPDSTAHVSLYDISEYTETPTIIIDQNANEQLITQTEMKNVTEAYTIDQYKVLHSNISQFKTEIATKSAVSEIAETEFTTNLDMGSMSGAYSTTISSQPTTSDSSKIISSSDTEMVTASTSTNTKIKISESPIDTSLKYIETTPTGVKAHTPRKITTEITPGVETYTEGKIEKVTSQLLTQKVKPTSKEYATVSDTYLPTTFAETTATELSPIFTTSQKYITYQNELLYTSPILVQTTSSKVQETTNKYLFGQSTPNNAKENIKPVDSTYKVTNPIETESTLPVHATVEYETPVTRAATGYTTGYRKITSKVYPTSEYGNLSPSTAEHAGGEYNMSSDNTTVTADTTISINQSTVNKTKNKEMTSERDPVHLSNQNTVKESVSKETATLPATTADTQGVYTLETYSTSHTISMLPTFSYITITPKIEQSTPREITAQTKADNKIDMHTTTAYPLPKKSPVLQIKEQATPEVIISTESTTENFTTKNIGETNTETLSITQRETLSQKITAQQKISTTSPEYATTENMSPISGSTEEMFTIAPKEIEETTTESTAVREISTNREEMKSASEAYITAGLSVSAEMTLPTTISTLELSATSRETKSIEKSYLSTPPSVSTHTSITSTYTEAVPSIRDISQDQTQVPHTEYISATTSSTDETFTTSEHQLNFTKVEIPTSKEGTADIEMKSVSEVIATQTYSTATIAKTEYVTAKPTQMSTDEYTKSTRENAATPENFLTSNLDLNRESATETKMKPSDTGMFVTEVPELLTYTSSYDTMEATEKSIKGSTFYTKTKPTKETFTNTPIHKPLTSTLQPVTYGEQLATSEVVKDYTTTTERQVDTTIIEEKPILVQKNETPNIVSAQYTTAMTPTPHIYKITIEPKEPVSGEGRTKSSMSFLPEAESTTSEVQQATLGETNPIIQERNNISVELTASQTERSVIEVKDTLTSEPTYSISTAATEEYEELKTSTHHEPVSELFEGTTSLTEIQSTVEVVSTHTSVFPQTVAIFSGTDLKPHVTTIKPLTEEEGTSIGSKLVDAIPEYQTIANAIKTEIPFKATETFTTGFDDSSKMHTIHQYTTKPPTSITKSTIISTISKTTEVATSIDDLGLITQPTDNTISSKVHDITFKELSTSYTTETGSDTTTKPMEETMTTLRERMPTSKSIRKEFETISSPYLTKPTTWETPSGEEYTTKYSKKESKTAESVKPTSITTSDTYTTIFERTITTPEYTTTTPILDILREVINETVLTSKSEASSHYKETVKEMTNSSVITTMDILYQTTTPSTLALDREVMSKIELTSLSSTNTTDTDFKGETMEPITTIHYLNLLTTESNAKYTKSVSSKVTMKQPSDSSIIYIQTTPRLEKPAVIFEIQCTSNANCSLNTTCIQNACHDPCTYYYPLCPIGIDCDVIAHKPLCLCPTDTVEVVGCKAEPGKRICYL